MVPKTPGPGAAPEFPGRRGFADGCAWGMFRLLKIGASAGGSEMPPGVELLSSSGGGCMIPFNCPNGAGGGGAAADAAGRGDAVVGITMMRSNWEASETNAARGAAM